MNARMIKTVLNQKHGEFIASIDDPAVRKLVNKNSIVTGGCIVSMLLDEPINDFDYYFMDFETTKAVAEYYIAKFKAANKDSDVKLHANSLKDRRVKIYAPGNGVASEYRDDVYRDRADEEERVNRLHSVVDNIIADGPPYRPLFMTSNAITLSDQIQLITRFYGRPEEIHSNYDFVHCTNYWLPYDNTLELPNAALQSILAKELIYTGSKYPIASIIRSKKFIQRGWNINAAQYLKMCLQIGQLNLNNFETMEDQLTGVDVSYFGAFMKSIKEDGTFREGILNTNWSYLAALIDKILE